MAEWLGSVDKLQMISLLLSIYAFSMSMFNLGRSVGERKWTEVLRSVNFWADASHECLERLGERACEEGGPSGHAQWMPKGSTIAPNLEESGR